MPEGILTDAQFDELVERSSIGHRDGKKVMLLPSDPERRAMVLVLLAELQEPK